MDARIIEVISRLRSQQGAVELAQELSRTISDRTEPLSVERAQDNFSTVLNRARAGEMQIVGDDPQEQAVIISIEDLAVLLKAAAGSLSLKEMLDAAGFKPAPGERLVLEQGRRGLPELRLHEEVSGQEQ